MIFSGRYGTFKFGFGQRSIGRISEPRWPLKLIKINVFTSNLIHPKTLKRCVILTRHRRSYGRKCFQRTPRFHCRGRVVYQPLQLITFFRTLYSATVSDVYRDYAEYKRAIIII